MKRRTPWPLARLVKTCRSAPAVWIALSDLADVRRSSVVTPTRADLSRATGIDRAKTISTALSTLELARWIDRVHVPVIENGLQVATYLRVVIRRRGRKTPQDSLLEREGAGTRRRPLPPGRASAPATRAPEARSQDSEHDGPVVKIADIAAGVFGTGPRHD